MEEIRHDHPYMEGKPVAFVYEQEEHKPSYQVRQIGENGTNVTTGDLEYFSKTVKGIREHIIFLTNNQIREMLFLSGDSAKTREMTPDEQQVIIEA